MSESTQENFDINKVPTTISGPIVGSDDPQTPNVVSPQTLETSPGGSSEPKQSLPRDPEKPRVLAPVPDPIKALQDGRLLPTNSQEMLRYAKLLCDSGLVPASLDSPQKVVVAFQYAVELGIKPVTAMRQMMVVNGVPSIWGDLPLAIVRGSKLLAEFSEKILDKDLNEICFMNKNMTSQPYAAVCRAKRKDDGYEVERFFTIDDAVKAGLITTDLRATGKKDVWPKYLRRMLQLKARNWALKDGFTDLLSGVSIAEWDAGVFPTDENDARNMQTSSGKGDALTAEFSRKDEPVS